MTYLMLTFGLVLLIIGADILVRGSVALATKFKISPLIVGLTVVAFGTSMPEFVVSLNAAIMGNPGISVGNVVGSNICNIILILGISALVRPLTYNPKNFLADFGFLFLSTLMLFLIIFFENSLPRWFGILLLIVFVAFLYISYKIEKKKKAANKEAKDIMQETSKLAKQNILLIISVIGAGLGILVFGADILVKNAVIIARILNVPDEVIGLTLVAVGTSLPELATSTVAAFKKQNDIAIGNIVGSNIFNILFILGTTASILPLGVTPQIVKFDNFAMLITAIALPICLLTGKKLSRFEGGLFLIGYIGYIYAQYALNH